MSSSISVKDLSTFLHHAFGKIACQYLEVIQECRTQPD